VYYSGAGESNRYRLSHESHRPSIFCARCLHRARLCSVPLQGLAFGSDDNLLGFQVQLNRFGPPARFQPIWPQVLREMRQNRRKHFTLGETRRFGGQHLQQDLFHGLVFRPIDPRSPAGAIHICNDNHFSFGHGSSHLPITPGGRPFSTAPPELTP